MFVNVLRLTTVGGILAVALPASILSAQSDCTFDTCALRLRSRLLTATEVVRGIDEERVGRSSFFGFAPHLPMLADAGDSVSINYEAFRGGNNSGAIMELVGLTLLLAGGVGAAVEGSNDWSNGLYIAGGVPLVWGMIRRVQARDRLSRAIWWYNRSLR